MLYVGVLGLVIQNLLHSMNTCSHLLTTLVQQTAEWQPYACWIQPLHWMRPATRSRQLIVETTADCSLQDRIPLTGLDTGDLYSSIEGNIVLILDVAALHRPRTRGDSDRIIGDCRSRRERAPGAKYWSSLLHLSFYWWLMVLCKGMLQHQTM